MTRQLTATDAKARLLALLDDVSGGEEIEITKHGRTVARLVPATGPSAIKGAYAGIAMSDEDDETLFGTDVSWETA